MNPIKCEKRMGNGAYCKRDWVYIVRGSGFHKKCCATHLINTVEFIAKGSKGTCTVEVIDGGAPVTKIGPY